MVTNQTLIKIAAIGGFLTASMGFAYRSKINSNIAKTDYYKEAMKTVRSHKGAIHLLGEPIKDCNIDVTDSTKNVTRNLSAQYAVPVKGAKEYGTVYFWANRQTSDDKWSVNRIELELKKDNTRRLLIKNVEVI
ncbi:PREDICTED: uncharacterized protein LOC108566274 [Nicrophorus vespilloides]|uniref:Uncharacterized protein LOC108566274 n=1 Tax=Nicrophorus vespilloides TaxID=110193 RepID=A0ABM1N422_NICVS|nr:PREDICTED: uncharacterized protein LOC108566274 [Nicrophorus vespilloides]